MTVVALPADVQLIWWITLAVGLVIAVVVVVLLQLLLNAVGRIEGNVKVLWHTATTVARNTSTTWMLNDTGDALESLKAEALRHDALLTAAPGRPSTHDGSTGGESR